MRCREGQRARISVRPGFGEQPAKFGAGARLLRQQPLRVVDQRAGVYCVQAAAKVRPELRGAQLMEQRAPVQAVARADQVHGVAHQVQPDHLARLGQLGQLSRSEVLEPGPQSHVRGARRLGLHAAQVLDRVDGPYRGAAEQVLASQRGPVETTLG
jgi:hypothetical protein